MAGKNPYIKEAEYALPTKPYTITIRHEDGESSFVVDPGELPYQRSGLPGSILDICEGHGIELEHTCGGVCACSTCHVHILKGGETCPRATEDEEDMLDEAPDVSVDSRLACQCVPNGTQDLLVLIPKWNRNQVTEGH
jgi:ferredoxin, 2Fe-2S